MCEPESREEAWARVSALAGLDAEGGIAPPADGMSIDRSPSPFWRVGQPRQIAEAINGEDFKP